MDDFTAIIGIRQRKADALRRVETASNTACDAARMRLAETRDAKLAYLEEIRTLEIDLLTELVNSEITIGDLGKLEATLLAAEQKAKALAADHDLALAQLLEREAEVEAARLDRRVATSKLNRISEIDRGLRALQTQLDAARQETELEEFVETMPRPGAGP